MTTKNLSLQNKENTLQREESVRHWLSPAVDIHENDEGLVLHADMPGVTREMLDIGIEEGILTIQARIDEVASEVVFRDAGHTGYQRRFQLPENLDLDKVDASLKDGVLTLAMPKSEAAKPRRIDVTVH
ncbi:MAG: molecular chaperone [Desulfuromonas sp.]|nr:MAG: molecular chaperone [Desulfuromonas sp.]